MGRIDTICRQDTPTHIIIKLGMFYFCRGVCVLVKYSRKAHPAEALWDFFSLVQSGLVLHSEWSEALMLLADLEQCS